MHSLGIHKHDKQTCADDHLLGILSYLSSSTDLIREEDGETITVAIHNTMAKAMIDWWDEQNVHALKISLEKVSN